MSVENDRTVNAYIVASERYIKIEERHVGDGSGEKYRKLEQFISEAYRPLPDGASILEIGAGPGIDAQRLRDKFGYIVTASDIDAPGFVDAVRKRGFEPVAFNVVKDDPPGIYDGVFCWRVLQHLMPKDVEIALGKIYSTLRNGGRCLLSTMNREASEVDFQEIDFDGEYHIGAPRIFYYWRESDLSRLIEQAGFRIVYSFKDGGKQGNKWLVYILEK